MEWYNSLHNTYQINWNQVGSQEEKTEKTKKQINKKMTYMKLEKLT